LGSKKCNSCRTSYDGGVCPLCSLKQSVEDNASAFSQALDEHAERIAASLEESTFEARMAAAEAIEEQKNTTANAWKLQAAAKIGRASSLHASGMHQEALQLALQSIQQDPGNLDGFIVVIACLKSLGRDRDGTHYFENQIKLLSTSDYCTQPLHFVRVLRNLPDDDMLIRLFVSTVESYIALWGSCPEPQAEIINNLIDRKNFKEAVELLEMLLRKYAAPLQLLDVILRAAKELVAARLAVEVERIVELLATRSWSLLHQAYLMNVASHIGDDTTPSARAFLQGVRFENRASLESDIRSMNQLTAQSKLDSAVVTRVRGMLLEKYAIWKPQLERFISTEVVKAVKVKDFAGYGAIVGIVSYFVLFLLSLWYAETAHTNHAPMAAVTWGSLFGAIIFGNVSGALVRQQRIHMAVKSRLQAAFKDQNNVFDELQLPPVVPDLSVIPRRWPRLFVSLLVIVIFVLCWLPSLNPPLTFSDQSSAPQALVDQLAGSSLGNSYGIRWVPEIGNHGALFSAANASRIEYPRRVFQEGTIELWIKVDSGYVYDNNILKSNRDTAMIFSTDAEGGDVAWPGAAKLFVSKYGDIWWWMATGKYNKPATVPTKANGTNFRFGRWHALGVSYGSQGQFIMLDGKIVVSAPKKKQILGCAGTNDAANDMPTIGETVSHLWGRRYQGGFEGVVAQFRASPKQQDWYLANHIGD
jgi:tetratricopeptide (TPR) repeat protein